jgi:L,D-peptidoglycan transpeptidase YkuD (ErfK/YbiS/YcfS/YnhG family)
VYFGLWFARPKPPLLLLNQARMALSAARHAEAPTYAPKLWQQAEDSWEHTLRAFQEQRRRWFVKRDFSGAAQLAQRTYTLAVQAQVRAVAARDSLAEHARTAASAAQREIDDYRAHFRDLPGSSTYRERATRSELLLLEAQAAARRGDVLRAAERLREAKEAIGLAGNGSANTVRAYFAKVPTWQEWAEETIAYSKEHDCTVVIVDKFAHTCRVYRAGKPVAEFSVELGPNWMGHKRHRGDNATPEGQYVVTQKKAKRSTTYYKALVINYPNEADRRQFEVNKRSGQLPPGAQIGGLIEIHGEGGKGFDWTNGCVALSNADMDRLYDMVDVGTRVTIVGSLRSWESCFRGTNYATLGTQ